MCGRDIEHHARFHFVSTTLSEAPYFCHTLIKKYFCYKSILVNILETILFLNFHYNKKWTKVVRYFEICSH